MLSRPNGFRGVVVATGHVTDAEDRAEPRFPESQVGRTAELFAAALDRLGVDERWLLICGGARGGDLLAAAEACSRGATVWLLLAHPAERFVETSVGGGAAHWVDDYWNLLARTPSWTIEVDEATRRNDEVYRATNRWMLEVARAQAGRGPVHLIAVWDGEGAVGEGGTADMVVAAEQSGIDVEVIDPAA